MPKYLVTVSRPFSCRESTTFEFESNLDIDSDEFIEAALEASGSIDDSLWDNDYSQYEVDYFNWTLDDDPYEIPITDNRQLEAPL